MHATYLDTQAVVIDYQQISLDRMSTRTSAFSLLILGDTIGNRAILGNGNRIVLCIRRICLANNGYAYCCLSFSCFMIFIIKISFFIASFRCYILYINRYAKASRMAISKFLVDIAGSCLKGIGISSFIIHDKGQRTIP